MELRVLKYFLMVAREENITRAADLLHVTQPTLSRQLMQLEEELGVKLFHRGRHNIMLTDDGLLLKQRAQEIVSLAEMTEREFLRKEGELTGEIVIGSGEARSVHLLTSAIVEFRKLHPMVHFHLVSATADTIQDQIEKGLLDMGLLMEPVDIGKYEFTRMPNKEQWCLMVPADSPLAQRDSFSPQDLTGLPLILPRRELVRNEIASWFGDSFDSLDVVGTCNLVYNTVVMVARGMGYALSLRHWENVDPTAIRFVPLSPTLETGSVLVWKKHNTFSPATSAFLSFVKPYFQNIPTPPPPGEA